MKIKLSTKSKRPVIIHQHEKFYGFSIAKLPNRFAELLSEKPIRTWFNYKGYTFIEQEEFRNLFGQITIE
jgi:hypothetical protein